MSNILVTGGAGFIASHVVDAFVAAGHYVTVVDNLSHGRRANLNPAATFCELDIRQTEALNALFADGHFEYVCHHAALISVRDSLVQPAEYVDVNIVAGIGLLELARRHGVRKVLFASSGGAAYGEGRGGPPFREDRAPHPLDPYGASKVAFEYYLHVYRENFGLDYAALRYANVYGPRQDPFGEGGVVAIFAQHILAGQRCTINGNGQKVRDFVYAGDVAAANLLALTHGSGIYNIGTGVPATVQSVFDGLRAAVPGYNLEPIYDPDKPGEVWVSCLNYDLAHVELGWQPAVTLAEGLRRTSAYFAGATA
jgi:UDP-glucose 4-epimerase